MAPIIHITSGDNAGGSLSQAGVPGEVFVWHDILYDGPRRPGWPDEDTLRARARFIEQHTGGGLGYSFVLDTFHAQYEKLAGAGSCERIVLWFDACLFDQSMLCHILTCLQIKGIDTAELLCIDSYPGIEPYDGVGQLRPEQMASVYFNRTSVSSDQFSFAHTVDRAFALQDMKALEEIARMKNAPLPWVPAAATRWIAEQPDTQTGLGRLQRLAFEAIRAGVNKPRRIFKAVAENDTHPVFWGDTTLWAAINDLVRRRPPLVKIEGPADALPQWEGQEDIREFSVTPIERSNCNETSTG